MEKFSRQPAPSRDRRFRGLELRSEVNLGLPFYLYTFLFSDALKFSKQPQ